MVTSYLDFPIVTRDILEDTLREAGIRPWRRLEEPMPLQTYLRRDLREQDRLDADRFAPKPQVVILEQPSDREPYVGFRMVYPYFALTFAPIDHPDHGLLVPVVGEYKHGMEQIGISVPAGVGRDTETPANVAMREMIEELGIGPKRVTPLGRPDGIVISGRNNTQRYFPFLGIIEAPIIKQPAKLDTTEFLCGMLIPLKEWIAMVFDQQTRIYTLECSSITTTILALRALKEQGLSIDY